MSAPEVACTADYGFVVTLVDAVRYPTQADPDQSPVGTWTLPWSEPVAEVYLAGHAHQGVSLPKLVPCDHELLMHFESHSSFRRFGEYRLNVTRVAGWQVLSTYYGRPCINVFMVGGATLGLTDAGAEAFLAYFIPSPPHARTTP